MRIKTSLSALVLVITFLLNSKNVNAKSNIPVIDSVCCMPDSLTITSVVYPMFCVRWKVPSDSTCLRAQRYEVQWKHLTDSIWQSQVVIDSSGTYVNFCDSVDTCGVYQVRVRTKCNDSTYSNWTGIKKFLTACGSGRASRIEPLSISPNPASTSIFITAKDIQPGPVKILVVNMAGRVVAEKITYAIVKDQLMEKLSIGTLPKGLYFISILSNGRVIKRGKFLKE